MSRRHPQRCEGGGLEAQLEAEATTTSTAVAGSAAVSTAVAVAAAAERGEAAAVAEVGSTPDGEAGAARAPTASKRKLQSACFESFFFYVK